MAYGFLLFVGFYYLVFGDMASSPDTSPEREFGEGRRNAEPVIEQDWNPPQPSLWMDPLATNLVSRVRLNKLLGVEVRRPMVVVLLRLITSTIMGATLSTSWVSVAWMVQ